MMTQVLLMSFTTAMLLAAEFQEFDVGAKWNIEYRVLKNSETDAFYCRLINRNDYGVRLSISVSPSIGSGNHIDRSVIIGKNSGTMIGPLEGDLSRYAVTVREVKKGVVAQKRMKFYDMNGQLVDTSQHVFIGEEETDLNVLSGLDIGYALDALGLEYNRDTVLRMVKSGKVYGYGLLSGDAVRSNYQYLEVPSKEKRNGIPIWVIQFELESSSNIVSAFKRYQIF
jgi:hypothetical protein